MGDGKAGDRKVASKAVAAKQGPAAGGKTKMGASTKLKQPSLFSMPQRQKAKV